MRTVREDRPAEHVPTRDAIRAQVKVELKRAEDELAFIDPPMGSITWMRFAVEINTYRKVLKLIDGGAMSK